MFALSLVIQFAYKPLTANCSGQPCSDGMPWLEPVRSPSTTCCGGTRGQCAALIPRILRFSAWLRADAGPVYLSLFRIWLAAALLTAAAHVMLPQMGALSTLPAWLPLDVAARFRRPSPWPAVCCCCSARHALLLRRRAPRVVANAMIDPRETDAVYLLMSSRF